MNIKDGRNAFGVLLPSVFLCRRPVLGEESMDEKTGELDDDVIEDDADRSWLGLSEVSVAGGRERRPPPFF